MQAEWQPDYPLLYSLWGFRYCDLLLAEAERAAWQRLLHGKTPMVAPLREACRVVSMRAAQTLEWAEDDGGLFDVAQDHLTLGRAALYAAFLDALVAGLGSPAAEFDAAVSGLRRAGTVHELPRGLLARSGYGP
jgi:hypothetical protein